MTLVALDEVYELWKAPYTPRVEVVVEAGRRFAGSGGVQREYFVEVLNALELAPRAGRFSRLTTSERQEELVRWGTLRAPSDPAPTTPGGDVRVAVETMALQRRKPKSLDDQGVSPSVPFVEFSGEEDRSVELLPPPDLTHPALVLRALRHSAFMTLASLYYEDTRGMTDAFLETK